jgi:UDP:flavonoid glycosyltransferase YjiC (YdhE family)
MRVLMTWTWPTHYLHMVPLGWALRAAGHEVRVASRPALAATTVASGLPALPVGHDIDVMAVRRRPGHGAGPARADGTAPGWREPPRQRIIAAIGTWATVAAATADDLVSFARSWRPDLIVYDPMAYAGVLAADVVGVPAVRHIWGVDLAYGNRDDDPHLIDDVPEFKPLLDRFGLDSFDDLGALTLDPFPPSMQLPTPLSRQHLRYVPYNGPGVQPGWSLEPPHRPRVCITWGTTGAQYRERGYYLAPRAVAAAAELGVEVIVATTPDQRELLGELPDGVRVAESVPLHMLLDGCSAIVHQGGGGTTLTALRAGVPQLVVGQLPDHRLHAHRVAEAGVGLQLDADDAEPTALREGLARLLKNPAHPAAAAQVREEILRQPSPAEVVPVLEHLARTGAPMPVIAEAAPYMTVTDGTA